jgi:mannosyltransferase OCH1-like enzyme
MIGIDNPPGRLPRIIHQTYSDRNLPPLYRQNIARIKRLCPGWEYRFYDDVDVRKYIAGHFPGLLKYYERIDPRYGAARADFFRYLVVYRDGGVYLDLKSTLTRPLDEVLSAHDGYLLSHWKNGPGDRYPGYGLLVFPDDKPRDWPERGEFQQWFIVSPPGHPFLRKTVERICQNIDNYCPLTGEVGRAGVLKLTGPVVYTQAILSLMDTVPHAIVDAEDDLGFGYSILPEPRSHETGYRHKHYSRQKCPIVKPRGLKLFTYFPRAGTVRLIAAVKRIKRSIVKRMRRCRVPA